MLDDMHDYIHQRSLRRFQGVYSTLSKRSKVKELRNCCMLFRMRHPLYPLLSIPLDYPYSYRSMRVQKASLGTNMRNPAQCHPLPNI